eukprot:c28041_g3_i1 orf=758-2164(+)
MSLSGGNFHGGQCKPVVFTKSDTDNDPMEGTHSRNGHYSTGTNRSDFNGASHKGGLCVGAGKVSGSSNGNDLRNAINGAGAIGSSPICRACSHFREASDLGAGKSGNNHSGELPKWATKTSSEASVMVTGSQIGAKSSKAAREVSTVPGSTTISSKGSPNCGWPAVGSLRVGGGSHGDNASSGGSSSGGSPTTESFKGGKVFCIGNILGNGGSSNGGVVKVPGGSITGSMGKSPTPATYRGTSTPKISGEIVSNGNGSTRGASALKLSGEGSLTGGTVTGNRSTRGIKSTAGSPVNGSLPATNIPVVGNLCRGNVLNGNGQNRCNGKADGVLGIGNLCSGISGKGNGKGDAFKKGMESLGTGNVQHTGECLAMKRALASTDAEEVKNAGNEEYKKGHFSEALSLYDRAIALSMVQPSYRSNRAAALTGLGRLAEAVQECEEAIKLDPSYVRAHLRAGSLYLRCLPVSV